MNNFGNNPYVGARTFETKESDLFFGREREALDLLSLVISDRLVLFYAQSGAGKSSIINTRLIPGLIEAEEYRVLRVGRLRRDESSEITSENIYVCNLISSLINHNISEDILSKLTLSAFFTGLEFDNQNGFSYNEHKMSRLSSHDRSKTWKQVLIIDQFEELFTTYEEEWEKRENFFRQLAEAMAIFPSLMVLLVMREDYIANLDPYAYLLPGKLRTRYYMQRLNKDQAIDAVEGPAMKRGRAFANGVAKELVDSLSSIAVRKPDNTWEMQAGQYVEPVQLQVVCSNLWERLPDDITDISKEIKDRYVGNMNQALGNFYGERVHVVSTGKNSRERQIRERDIRRWFEEKLIIDGKRRNMVAQETGGTSGGLDDTVIREFIGGLVREEKRSGGATFYELTHDRMVEPIIENNKIWDMENRSPFRSQAEVWEKTGNEVHLLTDQSLVEAEQWAQNNQDKLNTAERDFLNDSRVKQSKLEEMRRFEIQRQEQERKNQEEKLRAAQALTEVQTRAAKRARQFTIVSLGLALMAIIATIFAFLQLRVTNQQKIIAQTAEAEAKAAEIMALDQANVARTNELSTIALDRSGTQLDLAILLGLQADYINSNTRTQNTLLALQQRSNRLSGILKTDKYIYELQFSPDGRRFATRDENGITFWDANTLKELNTSPINGHFSGVTALIVSKDGKLMASGASDGTLVIWDMIKREKLSKPVKANTERINHLAISMDGKTIASASSNWTILWDITDPANPRQIGSPLVSDNSVQSLLFSPDGKKLVSGEYSAIIVWNIENPIATKKSFNEHTNWVNDLAFNSSGTILASASDDAKVILWRQENDGNLTKISEVLNENSYSIKSLVIGPKDNMFAAGDSNGSIVLWDITDPGKPKSISKISNQRNSWITNLSFNPAGDILAFTGNYGRGVTLWDVKDPKKTEKISSLTMLKDKYLSNAVFSNEGRILIVSSYDSTITYWDVSDPKEPTRIGAPLQGHPGRPSGMSFSQDNASLLSYGDDGSLILEIDSMEPIGFGAVNTSPDVSVLAYQIWDKNTEENLIRLRDGVSSEWIGDPIPGQFMGFSSDSKRLIYQTYETESRYRNHLWNISSKRDEISFLSDGYAIFRFSQDGRYLYFVESDPEIDKQSHILFDTDKNKRIAFDIQGYFGGFSSANRNLIYQSTDVATGTSVIKLWDIEQEAELKNITGDWLVVSSDGSLLAYRSYDASNSSSFINVVDATTGETVLPAVQGNGILGMSSNGRIILYSSTDYSGVQSIHVMNTQTGEKLASMINSYLYSSREVSNVLIYEFKNNNDGSQNILTVNEVTGQKIGDILYGAFLKQTSDGKILVYQNGAYIYLFDTTNGSQIGDPILGNYMATSEDGRTIATRTDDNKSVNLWDSTKTWPFGAPLRNLPEFASSATISLNGTTLAWVNKDGGSLYDISSETLITGPIMTRLQSSKTASFSFSPDGKLLAIQDMEKNTTTLLDIETGKQLGDPIKGGVFAMFSPDSRFLSTIDFNSQSVILWDLSDLKNIRAISDHISGAFSVFSPDSSLAIFGSGDDNGVLELWDLTSKTQIDKTIPGGYATISPNGKMLAVINLDDAEGKTEIWDLNSFKVIGRPIPGGAFVSFSRDSKNIAIGNSNNSTTIWDVETRKPIGDPIEGGLPLRFSRNGEILVLAGQEFSTITLWDLKKNEQIGDTIHFGTGADFFNFPYAGSNSDDTIFAFIDESKNSKLFNVVTNTELPLPEYPGEILGISLNQNGPFFAQNNPSSLPTTDILAINGTQGLLLWDLKTNKALSKPIPIGAMIPATKVIVSPDGNIAAFLIAEDSIYLRDLATGVDTRLESSGQITNNMVFSADSSRFWALTNDNTLISWDVDTGEITISATQPLKGADIPQAIFSPDGKFLVYKSNDNGTTFLSIWDIAAEGPYLKEPIELNSPYGVITFSHDGALLAYNDDSKISLYRMQTKEHLGDLLADISYIQSINIITEDDSVKYIITMDWNRANQIWDWTTRTKIGNPTTGNLQFIGSSDQKHEAIYMDSSGRLIRWKWDPNHSDWQDLLCPIAKRNFTLDEWKLYFPDEKYPVSKEILTCTDYPAGQ